MRQRGERPVHASPFEGRAAATLVVLLLVTLLAGCQSPGPSSAVTGSGGPAATSAAGAGSSPASASPGAGAGTPPPVEAPVDGDWEAGVVIPDADPVAAITPTRASANGVATDTSFRLQALDGSDPADLAAGVSTEPAVDLRVSRDGDAAILTPAEPLVAGQRYRLTLAAADGTVRGSWAVQAQAPLEIAGTTPYDEATDVPLDTGIEVLFNQRGVSVADAERFIRIEPDVAGHVEQAGRTVAFLPDRPLEAATVYTVTVRAGLPVSGTDTVLADDRVFRFETAANGTSSSLHAWFPSRLVEAGTADRAVIRLSLNEDDEDSGTRNPTEAQVTVHALAGLEAAEDAWRAIVARPEWASRPTTPPVPVDGLPLVLDQSLRIQQENEEDPWSSFVVLPAPLPRGAYLVTLTLAGTPSQVVLQATDLALYHVTTTTRTVVWANSLADGRPVAGAAVTLAGGPARRTDSQGIANLPTPTAVVTGTGTSPRPLLEVTAGRDAVFAPMDTSECDKCDRSGESRPWWLVFQADRSQYRPTDTVNTWGLVRSRASGAIPEDLEVRLGTYADESGAVGVIASLRPEVDRNGAFMAQIPLGDIPYGEYRLQLFVNGERVMERDVYVAVIEKPAWALSMATARRAVVSGDTVRVTTRASFFDGTPVAGVQLRVQGSGKARTVTSRTDGSAAVRVPLRVQEEDTQWEMLPVTARPSLPEEAQISTERWVCVFRAAVVVQSDAVVDGRTVVVSGSVHDVALKRLNASSAEWVEDVSPFGAPRARQSVRIVATETRTIVRQTGTRYDWILRRVVPVYETTERVRTLPAVEVRTDAKGRFRATFATTGKDRSYEIRITTRDDKGRATTDHTWAETPVRTGAYDWPSLQTPASETGASVDDVVRVRFTGGYPADGPARYLWVRAQEGVRAVDVTAKPVLSFRFRATDVPDVTVLAARFDGRSYTVPSEPVTVRLREADRALAVRVTPDRTRYRPGARATLTVRTTVDGRPAAASVYVGVVDEKLVSMGLVALEDPLSELLMDVGSGIIGTGWTHNTGMFGGAEGGDTTGGGGPDGSTPRDDFRDWLVARLVRTGADGIARVSFDLSDDLTSWHAYAAGVSHSLRAGIAEALLPVSLPFFAELTMAESYLVGDRATVAVRAYGSGLDAGEAVTFTVSSDTLGMAPVTVTAPAFRAAYVALPALTAGSHRIRVMAASGSGEARRTDTLIRTIAVLPTRARQATVTWTPLERPLRVTAGTGFTTLVLGDAGRGRVLPVLEELASGDPVRGDRALAAAISERVLRDTFGVPPEWGAMDVDLDPFQGEEGGFALIRHSSEELDASALAALSGDPRLTTLDWYFDTVKPSTREQAAWLLAGRAASGQAVLDELAVLAGANGLTIEERVAVAIAAYAAGDEILAAEQLRVVLREAGERQGRYVRVVSPTDDADSAVLTARLAIVAAGLGEPVAADMDAYVALEPPRTTLVALERALAAQAWVRRIPAASAQAALTVDGRRTVLDIDASRPVVVSLTPAQAASAVLAPVAGSVLVTTRTDVPLDTASLEAPGWLQPRRTVKPAEAIGIDDAVIVRIVVDRPPRATGGCLRVTELVPSGLVPIAPWTNQDEEESSGPGQQPDDVLGQRVTFCVDQDPDDPEVTLRYAARVVTPGRYRWEPTLLQLAGQPEVGTVIPETVLVIDRPD